VSEGNGDKARLGETASGKPCAGKKNQEFRRNLVTLPAIHVSTQRMSGLGWRVDPNAEVSPQLLHTYRSDRA
jgi:hypothetical protein